MSLSWALSAFEQAENQGLLAKIQFAEVVGLGDLLQTVFREPKFRKLRFGVAGSLLFGSYLARFCSFVPGRAIK